MRLWVLLTVLVVRREVCGRGLDAVRRTVVVVFVVVLRFGRTFRTVRVVRVLLCVDAFVERRDVVLFFTFFVDAAFFFFFLSLCVRLPPERDSDRVSKIPALAMLGSETVASAVVRKVMNIVVLIDFIFFSVPELQLQASTGVVVNYSKPV